ncbi:ATP-binding cassette domain-containing protein [Rhodobacter sp. 24-YEA-8]|uniref:ATP-binding cassette domain-containing protein n=1 Tax=Rhodobacter sp. 24-YEA-8 TaxID=1884310 RepID=UPI0008962381|nr:ATP-binding cassette domain-containing protein [Rhodobacter sp. 24-YEA-8]SED27456.1 peptide/nickel transport system ATP-binding protein [Rhodobacter sp. 24-YEA-8]
MTEPLLRLENIRRTFRSGSRVVTAAGGVSLHLAAGETLGIVGESGSGKSTIGRIATGLETADAGRVLIDGADPARLRGRAQRAVLRKVQMIFQDPYSSLNPRLTVGMQVAEGLADRKSLGRDALRQRLSELFVDAGLEPGHIDRYPHEFSGGQRQRVAIARALAPEPRMIVADEPVSALDLTVQAQIIDLMIRTQARRGLSWLFISHDISVVARLCDRVAVMYRGRIVEQGPAASVIRMAGHPYTRNLLEAVPRLDHRRTGAKSVPHILPEHGDDDQFEEVAPGHLVRRAR